MRCYPISTRINHVAKRRRRMLRTRGTCPDSESTFYLNADFYSLITLPEPSTKKLVLFYFLFQTPNDSERVSSFAGADESALFQRLDGIAIGRQRAYFFIVFQTPQNWVAAERISFKLVPVLDVRKQLLFNPCEFRQKLSSFFLRHFSPPFAGSLVPCSR